MNASAPTVAGARRSAGASAKQRNGSSGMRKRGPGHPAAERELDRMSRRVPDELDDDERARSAPPRAEPAPPEQHAARRRRPRRPASGRAGRAGSAAARRGCGARQRLAEEAGLPCQPPARPGPACPSRRDGTGCRTPRCRTPRAGAARRAPPARERGSRRTRGARARGVEPEQHRGHARAAGRSRRRGPRRARAATARATARGRAGRTRRRRTPRRHVREEQRRERQHERRRARGSPRRRVPSPGSIRSAARRMRAAAEPGQDDRPEADLPDRAQRDADHRVRIAAAGIRVRRHGADRVQQQVPRRRPEIERRALRRVVVAVVAHEVACLARVPVDVRVSLRDRARRRVVRVLRAADRLQRQRPGEDDARRSRRRRAAAERVIARGP